MRFEKARRVGVPAWLLFVVLGGCARTVLDSSVVDEYPGAEMELDFIEHVSEQRIISTNDALHGLFLLVDGDDSAADYDERLAEAKRRGWLPQDAEPTANESMEVGFAAMAGCAILDEKGGLTMRVFGPSPRYCARELVFLGILPQRTEYQSLSGLEFIDFLGRLEDGLPERGPSDEVPGPEDLPDRDPSGDPHTGGDRRGGV